MQLKSEVYVPVFEEEQALVQVTGGAVSKYSDDDFAASAKSGDYLPRLQLMTASSKPCKSGDFPINHFALIDGQTLKDLGQSVDVVVCAWRPKALDMGEQIIAIYDPKADADGNPTGEFLRIQEKASEKDSGCMYGHEYLVWLASEKAFALFFMGSASMRRESPNLKARMLKAATIVPQHIETKSYDWWSPEVKACSTPQEPLPSQEAMDEEMEKFNNPVETEVERVEDEDKSGRDR